MTPNIKATKFALKLFNKQQGIMHRVLGAIIVLFGSIHPGCFQDNNDKVTEPLFKIEDSWAGGDHGGFTFAFKIPIKIEVPKWEIAFIFPHVIQEFEIWQADFYKKSLDDRIIYIRNTIWNGHLYPGSVVDLRALVQFFKQPGFNYDKDPNPVPDILFLGKVFKAKQAIKQFTVMDIINMTDYTPIESYDPVELITIAPSTTPVYTTTTNTPSPGQEDNPWWFIKTTTTTAPPPVTDQSGNVVEETEKPWTQQYVTTIATTTKASAVAVSCPNQIVDFAKKCRQKKSKLKRCFLPQCTAGTKRFKAMQCWKFRGYCWCVNPRTGSKLSNTMIRYKNSHKLNCVTGEISPDSNLPEASTTSSTIVTTTLSTIPFTGSVSANKPVFTPRNTYDYAKIVRNSLLFFEAQRSGKLTNSRITWRKSAHLNDGQACNTDLSGGYYNSGGYVKFGFPTASAMTMLAWGFVEAQSSYDASGQTKYLKEALKWGADYFMKAHTSPYEFYAQVGNPDLENKEWGRPENAKLPRPCFAISPRSPGTDLAAETAAALAATALVYTKSGATNDDPYVLKLIKHAEQLYTFADRYRGFYSNSIRAASLHFPSHDYGDELVWAAMWLYKATGRHDYLVDAGRKYNEFDLGDEAASEFSWDRKAIGVQVLLAQASSLPLYRNPVEAFCDSLLRESGAYYTPLGLLYKSKWAPLRTAANAGFVCTVATKLKGITDERKYKYRKFAEEQMDYILGKTGKSFVIGYGANYPTRPHHRASTCSRAGACSWSEYHADKPNTQILTGAMVGGPDDVDAWTNDRTDYKTNGVGLDYNAGLQSAAAMLGQLQIEYKAWYDAHVKTGE